MGNAITEYSLQSLFDVECFLDKYLFYLYLINAIHKTVHQGRNYPHNNILLYCIILTARMGRAENSVSM